MDEPAPSCYRPTRPHGLTSPNPVTARPRPSATCQPPPLTPDPGARTIRKPVSGRKHTPAPTDKISSASRALPKRSPRNYAVDRGYGRLALARGAVGPNRISSSGRGRPDRFRRRSASGMGSFIWVVIWSIRGAEVQIGIQICKAQQPLDDWLCARYDELLSPSRQALMCPD
jgi:hypothetical protein